MCNNQLKRKPFSSQHLLCPLVTDHAYHRQSLSVRTKLFSYSIHSWFLFSGTMFTLDLIFFGYNVHCRFNFSGTIFTLDFISGVLCSFLIEFSRYNVSSRFYFSCAVFTPDFIFGARHPYTVGVSFGEHSSWLASFFRPQSFSTSC